MIQDVRKLPSLDNNTDGILKFSSKINNSAYVIESLNHRDYLFHPELLEELISKMDIYLKGKWSDYCSSESILEHLADFMVIESDNKCNSGILNHGVFRKEIYNQPKRSVFDAYPRIAVSLRLTSNVIRKTHF